MNLTVNVDADGVVVDFVAGLESFARDHGFTLDHSKWDLGMSREDFKMVFHEAVHEGLFAYAPPIDGAIDGLLRLIKLGHRVRIVTAKTLGDYELTAIARADTALWFAKWGLGDVEIAFTGDKYGKHGYPADVVIDDKPVLDGWAQRGATLNLLFDQPWNQDVVFPPGLRMREVYNWSEVLQIIEKEASRRDAA